MKYDENNLPRYPSKGSVQREEMKKLILLTQKEVYEQNRHQIKELIKQNNYKKINSLIIKDKDLFEFVNAHMLAYYKENQQALTNVVFRTSYGLGPDISRLPTYPSRGSIEREELMELILSTQKWIQEEIKLKAIERELKSSPLTKTMPKLK